jgi:3-hydroxymyristoyl/3-hydroxydecanoyl-(acyl carrier protein) dehydratase
MSMRLHVPASHPALPGHFPGRPIVPGVLLLDAVLEAVRAAHGTPAMLVRAKFAAPVLPETEVEVTLTPRERPGRVAFTCRAAGSIVLHGEVACRTAAT